MLEEVNGSICAEELTTTEPASERREQLSPVRKKKLTVRLYPGVFRPISAAFLEHYYKELNESRSTLERLCDAFVGLLLIAFMPFRSGYVVYKHRLSISKVIEITRLSWRYFMDPNEIVLLGISQENRQSVHVRHFEKSALMAKINLLDARRTCALTDKLEFHQRCAKSGLQQPKLYAYWSGTRFVVLELPGDNKVLAAKPRGGTGGKSFRLLYPQSGDVSSEASFVDFLLRNLGRNSDAIIQERITVHSSLSDLSLNALATLRLTTVLNERGLPEIVASLFRFPSERDALVDNTKAGGLMAAVGEDGRLMRGQGGCIADYSAHPVTGGLIKGRLLPDWSSAVELAKSAHLRAFGDYNLVGWDIALSDEGPILIEGNSKPRVTGLQRASGQGIGATRYGELLRYHLERVSSYSPEH